MNNQFISERTCGCKVYKVTESGKGSWTKLIECNMHSAAPDMLVSLRDLTLEIKHLVEDGTLPESAYNHPAMQAAYKAISKARGI